MFFGLMTLVNAPFDWLALGLTRALLRRGLASGGPGPYVFAFIDALVGIVLVALLAFAAVLAVQTFDDIAAHRAGLGARILPLVPIFDGLRDRPAAPEFWWIWLMLFSTQIPSAINLCVAAAALLRGLPPVNGWLLRRMPEDKPMREEHWLPVAGVLAGQIVGGPLLTVALIGGLLFYAIPFAMPVLAGWLRDFSYQLAALQAPAHLLHWLFGN